VASATASIARLGGAPLLRLQTDERLAALAAAGEERAFDLLARRYRGSLVRACQRMLSADQAEDAVQQALLNAHQALLRNGPPERFRPWLNRIATNAALKLIEASPETAPLDPEGVAGAESPEAAHERRERTRTALAAVAALPSGQRRALVARELEGRSHDEIAHELGLTGGAVRQLIYRARHTVRSAASALVPVPLVARLLASGSGGGAQLSELAAQGAGAGTAAKIAAVTVIAGGLAGGTAVVTPLGDRGPEEASVRAAEPDAGGGPSGSAATPTGEGSVAGPGGFGSSGGTSSGDEGDGGEDGQDSSGPGGGGAEDGDDDNSGEGSGSEREREGPDHDSSGPGSPSSGPGSSGDDAEDRDDGEDSSGPSERSGSGSGSGGSGSSHSGSSGSGSGSSGSGLSDSSGSGSSGSGSSGSGSSGSGSSGSGSSGSGGGSSGSGGSGSSGDDPEEDPDDD
jgi:RNA polymerase sigma factor (sigma-70 family)